MPATGMRTELGRIIFGTLYGLSTVALYALLDRVGAPTFYDKLLQVPVLNLSIQVIDRAARSPALAWLDPARLGRRLRPMRRSLVYTSVWVVVFGAMSFAQGVGDTHPGMFVPFWQQACREGRRGACYQLATMELGYCRDGSGWACNEFGIRLAREQPPNLEAVASTFKMACDFGFTTGCRNGALQATSPGALASEPPNLNDYRIVLQTGKGLVVGPSVGVYTRACNQGWLSGCERLALTYLNGEGPIPPDRPRAAREFDKICAAGLGSACFNAGSMYHAGDGVAKDEPKALDYLRKACASGFKRACGILSQQPPKTNN